MKIGKIIIILLNKSWKEQNTTTTITDILAEKYMRLPERMRPQMERHYTEVAYRMCLDAEAYLGRRVVGTDTNVVAVAVAAAAAAAAAVVVAVAVAVSAAAVVAVDCRTQIDEDLAEQVKRMLCFEAGLDS